MDNILDRIREARKKKGMTIAEASERLGFKSFSGYQKLEAGTTPLTVDKLVEIAVLFELSPHDLLGGALGQDGAALRQKIAGLSKELEDSRKDLQIAHMRLAAFQQYARALLLHQYAVHYRAGRGAELPLSGLLLADALPAPFQDAAAFRGLFSEPLVERLFADGLVDSPFWLDMYRKFGKE